MKAKKTGKWVFFAVFAILLFREKLTFRKRSFAGIGNYILCEIEYLFQNLGRKVKQESHSGGDSSEIPDMRNRSCKLNISHTFTANLFGCYLNAALLADLALKAYSFILSAKTFPVL